MNLCKKEKKAKIFELKFMNLCTEGCYKREEALDNLWNQAVAEGKEQEILQAKDEENDTPI